MRYLFFPLILAGVASIFAHPVNPRPFSVENQGDSLTLRAYGDERYRFMATEDGYLVLQDSLGTFYYADTAGTLSNVKAKNPSLRTNEEKSFLKDLDRVKVKKKHKDKNPNRLKHLDSAKVEKRAPWLPTINSSQIPSPMKMRAATQFSHGTNRFPVILVSGSGTSNCDSTAYYDFLNQKGYTKNGHAGSVRDYFYDQSNGVFDPQYDVYLVSVSKTLTSYLDNEWYLVKDAIANLLSKYPSFDATKYDADNDGNVDALAVIYAGSEYAANNLGGFKYDLEWNVGKQNAGNGKKFNTYLIISQMDMFGRNLNPAGVFIHEFSHTIGLLDHYAVNNKNPQLYGDYQYPGTHAWDVMDAGMYNGNDGTIPSGYNAFEMQSLEWIDCDTLHVAPSEKLIVEPLATDHKAYYVPVTKNEWYLVENRQAKKWDSKLPGHGMLIWHIDYDWMVWENNSINDDITHQRVDLVEAGNIKVPSNEGAFYSRYLEDDPFPGSQKVTEFSGFKSWSGTDLGIKLYSILESNGNVCFSTKSGVKLSDCEPLSSSSQAISSSSWMTAFDVDVVIARSSSSRAVGSSTSVAPWMSIADNVAKSVHFRIQDNVLSLYVGETGAKLKVFDVQGHLLHSENISNTAMLDLSAFAKTTKIIRVESRGQILLHEVVR
ncbi:MAG: M6 family metalloprotease domain-containing protein [Fibrobacter sp.]|nr:M6 family metalloprotease domain-containing protein [Fibrobacter sp.]